jgi:hypothetical protein
MPGSFLHCRTDAGKTGKVNTARQPLSLRLPRGRDHGAENSKVAYYYPNGNPRNWAISCLPLICLSSLAMQHQYETTYLDYSLTPELDKPMHG